MDDMLLTMIFLSILIIVGVIFGIVAGLFTLMLDNIMDRGHILDFLRLWRFEQLGGTIKEDGKLDFGERVNYYNSEYWALAKNKKSFMNWICPICMSIKIGWIFGAIIFIACFLLSETTCYWQGLFLFFVFNFVVSLISYATVRLLT